MCAQIIVSENAKQAALDLVLCENLNKVIWEECQLVWDSRHLIDNSLPPNDDAMAVFGVKGKMETPEHTTSHFQVRYAVDFGLSPPYRIHAAVNALGAFDRVDIIEEDSTDTEQHTQFRDAIMSLTQTLHSSGYDAAIKAFFAPQPLTNEDVDE